VLQHPDEDKHFMLANLDYAVVGNEEVQILECKTVGEYGSKLWRDGVPLYVLCQVQHQLAVTGKQAAHICALICGHETKIYKVTRNETVIQHIINAERHFWQCVNQDIPPSVDASDSAAKALQQLYPEQIPLTVEDLTQNEQANYLFNQLLEERHKVEQHQQYFDELKHQLQMMMKEAERAVFTGGSVTWKKSQDSISLDSKSFLNSILNIYSSFHKPKQEHDDFRFIRMVDKADTQSNPFQFNHKNPIPPQQVWDFLCKFIYPNLNIIYRGHHHD
jgi:predicted phage-related endonuclease